MSEEQRVDDPAEISRDGAIPPDAVQVSGDRADAVSYTHLTLPTIA